MDHAVVGIQGFMAAAATPMDRLNHWAEFMSRCIKSILFLENKLEVSPLAGNKVVSAGPRVGNHARNLSILVENHTVRTGRTTAVDLSRA